MLTCSKCGKFIAHPGAAHVCESVVANGQATKGPTPMADTSELLHDRVEKIVTTAISIYAGRTHRDVFEIASEAADAILAIPGLQAEAQAPASVDEKRLADIRTRHLAREVEAYGPRVPPFAAFEPSRSMHNDITFLLSCVGAPAPAPTMPTRSVATHHQGRHENSEHYGDD